MVSTALWFMWREANHSWSVNLSTGTGFTPQRWDVTTIDATRRPVICLPERHSVMSLHVISLCMTDCAERSSPIRAWFVEGARLLIK